MNYGNTNGKPRKATDAPIPIGCFNVNDLQDWIVGGKIPADDRLYISKYQGQTYHISKPNGKGKRYF